MYKMLTTMMTAADIIFHLMPLLVHLCNGLTRRIPGPTRTRPHRPHGPGNARASPAGETTLKRDRQRGRHRANGTCLRRIKHRNSLQDGYDNGSSTDVQKELKAKALMFAQPYTRTLTCFTYSLEKSAHKLRQLLRITIILKLFIRITQHVTNSKMQNYKKKQNTL